MLSLGLLVQLAEQGKELRQVLCICCLETFTAVLRLMDDFGRVKRWTGKHIDCLEECRDIHYGN